MSDVPSRSGGAKFKGEKIEVGQDVVGRDKNIYYGAVPDVTFHNSLPNQPYFFGRKEELAKIADALDPEAQATLTECEEETTQQIDYSKRMCDRYSLI